MSERKEAVQPWWPVLHLKSEKARYRNLETGLIRWFWSTPRHGKWERLPTPVHEIRPLPHDKEAEGG